MNPDFRAQRVHPMNGRFQKSSLILCTLTAVSQLVAQGLPPRDLNPGQPYRVIFQTEGRRNAASTDIVDYNTFVTTQAQLRTDLVALKTNWNAVSSTATVNARTNTQTDPTPPGPTGVPIYRADGVRVANDYDQLWSGALLAAPSTSTGRRPSDGAWTGTYRNGLAQRPLGTATPALGRHFKSNNAAVGCARFIRGAVGGTLWPHPRAFITW